MSSISFQELLDSNIEPPDGIVKEIEEMRLKCLRDLGNIDAKTLEVDKQPNDIKTRRATIQAKISQYDLILSPIRRVPAYIFYEIFHYCLPTLRNPIPRANEAPLSLTHVCRVWRSVALSSPRLWAQLHISFTEDKTTIEESIEKKQYYYDGASKERVTQILHTRYDAFKEWLSRSQASPLSISVNLSLNRGSTRTLRGEGSLSKITLELLTLIKSFADRLVDFEFAGPSEIYEILEPMFPIAEMKMLARLKIRPVHDGRPSTIRRQPVKLLNVPSLTNVSFAGNIDVAWNIRTSSVQFKNFTDLSLHYAGLSITTLDLLLTRCTNLVHFLAMVTSNYDIGTNTGPIHLPFLVALCIKEHIQSESMCGIYERIDAPRLKWVNYASYPSEPRYIRTIPITQLLQNCRELKKLTFDGASYPPSVMRTLYQSVRGITDLSIGMETRPAGRGSNRDKLAKIKTPQGQDTWNFSALIINGTANDMDLDSILLPRLETLDVYSEVGSIPLQVLQQFIESRMDSPFPRKIAALKAINIPQNYVENIDTWTPILHRAKAAGVDIKVDRGYLALYWTWPRTLSLERQMDVYGRTWRWLDVRAHMRFVD